jgi:hypothetical protein
VYEIASNADIYSQTWKYSQPWLSGTFSVKQNFVLSGKVPLLFWIPIQVSMVKRNFEICKRNIPEILAGVQNHISLPIAPVSNCRQPMRRQQ